MRRNTLLVDAAIALAIAGVILIVAPGLAIVAILAILALIVCGASFAVVGWRSRRARRRVPRSSRPATRSRRPVPRR